MLNNPLKGSARVFHKRSVAEHKVKAAEVSFKVPEVAINRISY